MGKENEARGEAEESEQAMKACQCGVNSFVFSESA